jgi:ligand-binding sensor domain-containing protein
VYTGPTAEDRQSSPQAVAGISSRRSQQLIASQDGMAMLSRKTGGLFVQGNNDLTAALSQVVDDGDGFLWLGSVRCSSTGRGRFNDQLLTS